MMVARVSIPVAASIRLAMDVEWPIPSALMMMWCFFPLLSVFNNTIDQILLIAVIPLRQQDILGSVGDSAPQGNVSRTAAHYLDDAAPLVGGGRIPYLINSLHGRVDG